MELIKKSWEDITIKDYEEILDVVNDSSLTVEEVNLNLLSILTGITVEDIYKTTIVEINSVLPQIKFLENQFKVNDNWKVNKVMINNKLYKINTEMTKFTIAQYIDFQSYWSRKDINHNIHNILSCIIVPDGCEYNEGYDIMDVQKELYEYMPITTANAIMFFFVKSLVTSIKTIQLCLYWRLKLEKLKFWKKKKHLQEIGKMLSQMESTMTSISG